MAQLAKQNFNEHFLKRGLKNESNFNFLYMQFNQCYIINLKKFVDVNGEISVDVPYFSTEIKIYPSKIISGGNVAKRVWAFSATNPYTIGAHDPDNISKTDLTLFE